MAEKIRYELSCPQHTPEGEFLGYLYRANVLEVFSRDERSGYPHNGGEHSLTLRVSPEDFRAFIDLLDEVYAENDRWSDRLDAFIKHALGARSVPIVERVALGTSQNHAAAQFIAEVNTGHPGSLIH